MSLVIEMTSAGGPEVLKVVDRETSPPAVGEVRIRQSAVGVNFVDVYQRSGLYPVADLPAVLGVEGVGTIEAVGAGVQGFEVGDRIAYAGLPIGGYAQIRNIPAQRLLQLPNEIEDRTAAASMLRGITAHMLLRSVCQVGPGMTVLVHAAAGGLGLILTAWAKKLGATVIGTVGSAAKADLAMSRGLDHVILYRQEDFVARVKDVTDCLGVDVAYDGIGGETLVRTLDTVRPFGTVVSVGQAGGSLPAIPLSDLGPGRSLCLARPSVLTYARDPEAYHHAASEVFALLASGLSVPSVTEFPLAEAASAHELLESGKTSGSLVLRC